MDQSSTSSKRTREESSEDEEDDDNDDSLSHRAKKGGQTSKPLRWISGLEDDFVDWDRLAATQWGQEPLTKYLPIPQVDQLVGWATHVQQPTPVDRKEANPLVTNINNNTPLPPTSLAFVKQVAGEILSEQKKSQQWQSFDQSALVAIGLALEETLTATVLPLAELHVARCRKLSAEPRSKECAFSEWTLPPEEAIEKLIRESNGSTTDIGDGLPTARPSARTLVPGGSRTSLLNMPSKEQSVKSAALTWCQAHGLDPSFVHNNMDLLRILLPHEPP